MNNRSLKLVDQIVQGLSSVTDELQQSDQLRNQAILAEDNNKLKLPIETPLVDGVDYVVKYDCTKIVTPKMVKEHGTEAKVKLSKLLEYQKLMFLADGESFETIAEYLGTM